MSDFVRTMKISEQGLELIRQFEGLRLNAYRDAGGIWTIGYGHTSAAGQPHVEQGMSITREEATRILARDAAQFANGVARRVHVEISQAQFDALVSFAYNVGLGNFERSSVLKAVNARDFAAVPRRLALWTKAVGKTLPGLVRRRAAEGALFQSGRPGPHPKGTPILARILRAILKIIRTLFKIRKDEASQ
jgi:lysozyme